MCIESEPSFWVTFEENRRWKVQLLLHTRKYYPAGPIQACEYQNDLMKLKEIVNKTDFIDSWSAEVENKVENGQNDKLKLARVSSQSCTFGLQGHTCIRTTIEKLQNQLFHVRREHKTSIWHKLGSFLCSCSPFSRKSTTGKKHRKNLFLFINRKDGVSLYQFQGVHMNKILKACGKTNFFLYNSAIHDLPLYWSFGRSGVATWSTNEIWFLDIEKTMKIKLGSIFEQLTEVRNRRGHARTFDMS